MRNTPPLPQGAESKKENQTEDDGKRILESRYKTLPTFHINRILRAGPLPDNEQDALGRIFAHWETKKEAEWLREATAYCVQEKENSAPDTEPLRQSVVEEIWETIALKDQENFPVPSAEEIASLKNLLAKNRLPAGPIILNRLERVAHRFYFVPAVWHDLLSAVLKNTKKGHFPGSVISFFPGHDPELVKKLGTHFGNATYEADPQQFENIDTNNPLNDLYYYLELCMELDPDCLPSVLKSGKLMIRALLSPTHFLEFVQKAPFFPKFFKETIRAHKEQIIIEHGHILLRNASFYPDLIKELLEDAEARALFLAHRPGEIGKNAIYYEETFRLLMAQNLLPESEQRAFDERKSLEKIQQLAGPKIRQEKIPEIPEKEILLIMGSSLQEQKTIEAGESFWIGNSRQGQETTENSTPFWDKVEKNFGFRPDKNAAITFGVEIEPQEEITPNFHAINELEEMRSFAVSEPETLPVLLENYRALLRARYPLPPGEYGQMHGTLHFSWGIGYDHVAKISATLPQIEQAVGAAILASANIPKIIDDTSFRPNTLTLKKYVLLNGNALPHMHSDLAPMGGNTPQALRVEWKGFSLPADDTHFSQTTESLETLARLAKTPGAFSGFAISEEGQSAKKEIIRLAHQAWGDEKLLNTLIPEGVSLQEYGARLKSLMEKLNAAKKETDDKLNALKKEERAKFEAPKKALLEALRKNEGILMQKISEDLTRRYRAGENIGVILKNLGHENLWEIIQGDKRAIARQIMHPIYANLRDFQETLESIDLAGNQAKEILRSITRLQSSIQVTRKKVEALQQLLSLEFKIAASRALQDAT